MVRILFARNVNGRLRQIRPVRRVSSAMESGHRAALARVRRPACPALRRGQLVLRFG